MKLMARGNLTLVPLSTRSAVSNTRRTTYLHNPGHISSSALLFVATANSKEFLSPINSHKWVAIDPLLPIRFKLSYALPRR
uniref:Uncharacterized protein n=1 Tax=Arundo donax TaxID=35708 RepID=A0A0A9FQ14_ARUDO